MHGLILIKLSAAKLRGSTVAALCLCACPLPAYKAHLIRFGAHAASAAGRLGASTVLVAQGKAEAGLMQVSRCFLSESWLL